MHDKLSVQQLHQATGLHYYSSRPQNDRCYGHKEDMQCALNSCGNGQHRQQLAGHPQRYHLLMVCISFPLSRTCNVQVTQGVLHSRE